MEFHALIPSVLSLDVIDHCAFIPGQQRRDHQANTFAGPRGGERQNVFRPIVAKVVEAAGALVAPAAHVFAPRNSAWMAGSAYWEGNGMAVVGHGNVGAHAKSAPGNGRTSQTTQRRETFCAATELYSRRKLSEILLQLVADTAEAGETLFFRAFK